MAKKKPKTSIDLIIDHLELTKVHAEMMGIKILNDTLQNILDRVSAKARELYAVEIENATLQGRIDILEELNKETTIDKLV
jgi:hypothetical protein